MPDYNIYIHSDSSNASRPTKPHEREGKATTPFSSANDGAFSSLSESGTNTATIGEKLKGAIGVGVSYLVSKKAYELVVNAVNTGISFYTSMTGDFRVDTNWNNFKATMDIVKKLANPMSVPGLVIGGVQNQINNQKAFVKAQEETKLKGDSVINYYTNLGV